MGKLSRYRGRRIKKNQSHSKALILLPLVVAVVATMLVTWHVTNDQTIDSNNAKIAKMTLTSVESILYKGEEYTLDSDLTFKENENTYKVKLLPTEPVAVDYSSYYDKDTDYATEIFNKLSYPTIYETRIGFLQDLEISRNYKICDLNLDEKETYFFSQFDNMPELITSGLLDEFYVNQDYHRFKISNCSAYDEFTLYDRPYQEADSIATLTRGNLLTYLGHFEDIYAETWYRVSYQDTVGYINIPENYLTDYSYTEDDVYWLALAISHEIGSKWVPEWARNAVGTVVLNRMESISNDYKDVNTIYDVLHQRNQYPWATRSNYATPYYEWCEDTARSLLEGCERELPPWIVFQSGEPITNNIYKTYYDEVLGSTTYFCY